jgi:hypothetical protein
MDNQVIIRSSSSIWKCRVACRIRRNSHLHLYTDRHEARGINPSCREFSPRSLTHKSKLVRRILLLRVRRVVSVWPETPSILACK